MAQKSILIWAPGDLFSLWEFSVITFLGHVILLCSHRHTCLKVGKIILQVDEVKMTKGRELEMGTVREKKMCQLFFH